MKEAPLFVRSYDLYAWLLQRLDKHDAPSPHLRAAILGEARALLDAVVLALSRFDTTERAAVADEHAALLRVHLRMAADRGLVDTDQLLYCAGELDDIGRQLGGWRKRLGS